MSTHFPTHYTQIPKHNPAYSVFNAFPLRLFEMPPNVIFRHEIPKALIINEPNLDSALVRTYGAAFTKTIEEGKWVILTPNIAPEDLKKHLFNEGVLFPESALKPEERTVPNPGFIIMDEQPETPKES